MRWPGPAMGRRPGGDDVAEHDRVTGDDGDHQADEGLVLGGQSDASVLGDGCSGLDARVGPSRRASASGRGALHGRGEGMQRRVS